MAKYQVFVKTSDKFCAGTDSNVYIRLIDNNGQKSKEHKLDAFCRDDFERGQLDEFSVECDTKLDGVSEIELWRDSSGIGDAWHLEYIMVKDGDMEVVFPFHRWIHPDKHYIIEPFDCSLPQHCKYLDQRNEELNKRKQEYQFTINHPNMPVQIKALPDDEKLSIEYIKGMGMSSLGIMVENAWIGAVHSKNQRFKSIDDIFKLFGYYSDMAIPKNARNWNDDAYFGHQRLNGTNPVLISLCKAIPDTFAVDKATLEAILKMSTDDAIQQKRLFIIDLTILEDIKPKEERVLTSPYCLLFLNDQEDLMPVAIQLFKTPGGDDPVFYSSDDPSVWVLAKLWYALADSTYHQCATHLGGTHIAMEGFCIIANRNLSPSHPLYKLLAPHFLFLLAVNTESLTKLMGNGGYADQAMTIGNKGMKDIIAKTYGNLDFDQLHFFKDLKRRGFDEETLLPNHHYRNDATLVYDVIHKYVTSMIHLFYKNVNDISEDAELQNFAQEVVHPKPEGLGCVNFPGGGHFSSHDQVIEVATTIIFTCSVQHAAVNFGQYETYAFPPASPMELLGQPPKDRASRMEQDIMDCFLTRGHMLKTILASKYLSQRPTNILGDFEVSYFHQPEPMKIIERFRSELEVVSKVISERDAHRKIPYEILNPKCVPNSISISCQQGFLGQ